ncbi:hypothetical protein HJC23_000249 [Cyclotella cryptica]|uniref:Selenoprotein S n=1 Tax=Cyclotella cryptica TaxID=29204 RepID=A0ABD3QCA3_9STRA|eukprot:CCRYP_006803-RA/>CCRYP_006803-RA protein AED:0.44 eAED:0.44 QI:0/-1/0/1/-1/1/1/0/220
MEEVTSQTGPQTLTFANHPNNASRAGFQPRPKPGPQLWAIVLASVGLYYLWTRILGRPLPSFLRKGGQRIGSKGHSDTEMAAAREKQQERLVQIVTTTNTSNSKEGGKVRERSNNAGNTPTPNTTSSSSLEEQRQQRLAQEKQRELEEKKRKQRQLYLRKKAELEKQEEERKKDEEFGPGWRYRQDPSVVRNVVNGMDPQSGGGGGEGGYKPQVCTRRGG